jgi:hypothetical protein
MAKTTDKLTSKYIRIAENANIEEFRAISDRVHKGELKLAYYAVDNDKGYHYYEVLK